MSDSDLKGIGEEILGLSASEGQDSNIKISDVDNLSSDNFEKFIAELFRSPEKNKIYQTQVTGGPGDQGADVIGFPHGNEGRGIIIQCKHSTNINKHQGNSGVQEVIGAKGVYEGKYSREFDLIVATNSAGFTRNAEEIARGGNVRLVDRETIRNMLAVQNVSFANLSGSS